MNQTKFGLGKTIGFIITFPFVIFLIFAFLYIPVSLFSAYQPMIGDGINPVELIKSDEWNPYPKSENEAPSFGIGTILKSNLRISIETTLLVLLPAFLFAYIILYLTPLWLRSILEALRNFLYLIPTILIAYLGYFYLSPALTGESGHISGLLTTRMLIIFVFPYAVFAFMYGLTKIWPSISSLDPTFSGRILRQYHGVGKIISFVFIIIFVALITFSKVFGETVIFSLLSGIKAPENFMDISQPASNLSATIVDTLKTDESGLINNSEFVTGIVLFITLIVFLITFIANVVSNLGLSIIGSIFKRENLSNIKTKFSKVPALTGLLKIIFSIAGLLIVGLVIYFIIANTPSYTNTVELIEANSETYPGLAPYIEQLTPYLETLPIIDEGILFFALNFIWYALLIGVPIGFFIGIVMRGSKLEHYILAVVRVFDSVPLLCVGIGGYVFFVMSKGIDGFNMFSAGITTAVFLAPKVAILTYEIISTKRHNYEIVKVEKPYISAVPYVFTGLGKILGTAFQVLGMMFGLVVTIMYTGAKLLMNGVIPDTDAPFMSFSHQMFRIMIEHNEHLDVIKPVLDNYYLKILFWFLLFFLIGTGLKYIITIIDSIRLKDFHKKID